MTARFLLLTIQELKRVEFFNVFRFEKPIEDIEEKILLLKNSTSASLVDLNSDIEKLQQKKSALIKKIFSKLTPWQITQIARHPMRPYTKDYIDNICDSFIELHGDRTSQMINQLLQDWQRLIISNA